MRICVPILLGRTVQGGAGMRWWTLAMLAFFAFVAMLARQAFTVLLVPMQRDLATGDAAMGFLSAGRRRYI